MSDDSTVKLGPEAIAVIVVLGVAALGMCIFLYVSSVISQHKKQATVQGSTPRTSSTPLASQPERQAIRSLRIDSRARNYMNSDTTSSLPVYCPPAYIPSDSGRHHHHNNHHHTDVSSYNHHHHHNHHSAVDSHHHGGFSSHHGGFSGGHHC
ncbi:hypothetical protein BDZ88DRAFT_412247 [Geranomyces variabilis]|nr:hypothetical protein BDZ88DRAFT_412247 [Geranomyces variabilis]